MFNPTNHHFKYIFGSIDLKKIYNHVWELYKSKIKDKIRKRKEGEEASSQKEGRRKEGEKRQEGVSVIKIYRLSAAICLRPPATKTNFSFIILLSLSHSIPSSPLFISCVRMEDNTQFCFFPLSVILNSK